ncbi:MAG: hypothetical protein QW685_05380 [Saccharolobus sp.]
MSSNLIFIESEKEAICININVNKTFIGVVSIRDVSDSVLLSLAEVMSY